MHTFNTAIWRKDIDKVNELYSKRNWGIPDYYAGDDETQPITVTQEQYDKIKNIPIDVDVIIPGPR
jgi:hypothetical protein